MLWKLLNFNLWLRNILIFIIYYLILIIHPSTAVCFSSYDWYSCNLITVTCMCLSLGYMHLAHGHHHGHHGDQHGVGMHTITFSTAKAICSLVAKDCLCIVCCRTHLLLLPQMGIVLLK